MPKYHKLLGPWTISAGATVGFSLSWANTGSKSDHGPIVPMADPIFKGFGRSAVKLTTFDVAKGRTGRGGVDVFYELKIRNENAGALTYNVELVEFQDLI